MPKQPRRRLEFDVALSFAGEDRPHAELLANILKDCGVKVFYDEFHKATLWGKDLYQHLQTIYRDKAKYCIVFVSKHYLKKNWTKHELKQAQARAFQDSREYILPLRLDDSTLPGVNHTVGYVDLRNATVEDVAVTLLEKLGRPTTGLDIDRDRAMWDGEMVEYNGATMAKFWPTRLKDAQERTSVLITAPFKRIRYGDEEWIRQTKAKIKPNCHDCAARIGEFHVPNCDVEECPNCKGQMLGCGCRPVVVSEADIEAWEEQE